MVERDGLENRCGRTVTVGSNPTLSAISRNNADFAGFAAGEMAEWSKVHDWKSCVERTSTEGSNPSLSAIYFFKLRGAVAQLGERQVRNLEVVGSIPICSTIFSIQP